MKQNERKISLHHLAAGDKQIDASEESCFIAE
jgi:hypothetical protein